MLENLFFKNDKFHIDRRIWKDFLTTWPHNWDVTVWNIFSDSTQGCGSNHGWRIHDVTVWAPNKCSVQGSSSNLGWRIHDVTVWAPNKCSVQGSSSNLDARALDVTFLTVCNCSVRGCVLKYFPLPLECDHKRYLVLKMNLSWTSWHWRGVMSINLVNVLFHAARPHFSYIWPLL